jgi:hypothetical protein
LLAEAVVVASVAVVVLEDLGRLLDLQYPDQQTTQ